MIKLTSVKKNFGHVEVLKDISIEINEGEIYGLIGHSGAGKSTLLRCINALEDYNEGSVKVMDKEVRLLSEKGKRELRKELGMIFQGFNLLSRKNVFQNVALPLEVWGYDKSFINKRVNELLEVVGLSEKAKSKPSELSGGQKQRVAIARALALEPKILLCDEATSALDPKTTESILDLLVKINQQLNITIVLITHQMEVVQRICHRIAVMSNGEIVEVGSVKDIFEHPNHLVTQQFVHGVSSKVDETSLKEELKTIYPNGKLLRLTFNSHISRQPILSKVMKESNVAMSIVHANLTNTLESSFGIMYVNLLEGTSQEYQQVIQKLEMYEVIVEVI